MGMLHSYICPFTPLPLLSLYPVSHPTPLPRYLFIQEDSLCESL